MKKLQVTITLDMDIPEDWTLLDHTRRWASVSGRRWQLYVYEFSIHVYQRV